MNPGMMKTPLVLKVRTSTTSSYGQPISGFTGTTQLFGQITDTTSEEKTNHLKLNLISTHKITMNFYPGINAYDRFEAQASRGTDGLSLTKTYEILSAVDYRQQGHTLEFICREIA